MGNINRLRNERGEASIMVGYCIGVAVGQVIGGLIWYNIGHDDGEKDQDALRTIQLQKEQIQTSLEGEFNDPNKLVLNSGEKTFTFDMTDVNGKHETCDGAFKVSNEVASVVGDISCKYVVVSE